MTGARQWMRSIVMCEEIEMRKASLISAGATPSGQIDPAPEAGSDPSVGQETLPPTEEISGSGAEDGDQAAMASMQISREGNPDNR